MAKGSVSSLHCKTGQKNGTEVTKFNKNTRICYPITTLMFDDKLIQIFERVRSIPFNLQIVIFFTFSYSQCF